MINTKQLLSGEQPIEEDRNICLSISCPNCQTGRTFKIDEGLKSIQNREMAWMGFHTFCEKCGQETSVNIGWGDATVDRYSYRKWKYYEEKALVVEDECGLREMKN